MAINRPQPITLRVVSNQIVKTDADGNEFSGNITADQPGDRIVFHCPDHAFAVFLVRFTAKATGRRVRAGNPGFKSPFTKSGYIHRSNANDKVSLTVVSGAAKGTYTYALAIIGSSGIVTNDPQIIIR